MQIKSLTLTAYNKKYGDDPTSALYVMNVSDGQLAFNVIGDMGKPDSIVVPMTFAPVDLTALTTRKALYDNSTFRRLINKQVLHIVDNEDLARALEEDAELAEEYKTVNGGIMPGVESSTVNAQQNEAANAKKNEAPKGKSQNPNKFLESVLVDAAAAAGGDDPEGRLKELATGLRRRIQGVREAEHVKAFIDAVGDQNLRDIALDHYNGLVGASEDNGEG
jgi:hypothetical protein